MGAEPVICQDRVVLPELLVDPSFAFSDEGLTWLEENRETQDGIVVSARFAEWLEHDRSSLDPAAFVAEDDRDAFAERRERLAIRRMTIGTIERCDRLGGLVHEYHTAA